MIISYSVSNFCSFDSAVEISFERTASRQHLDHLIDNKYLTGGVIYGANASGKSNFLKSLVAFKTYFYDEDISTIDLEKMQFKFAKNNVTRFSIEFIWNKHHYIYSMAVRPDVFVSENFELVVNNKHKKRIFWRKGFDVEKGDVLSGNWFKDKNTVSEKMSYVKMLSSMGLDDVQDAGAQHIKNLSRMFLNMFFVEENPKNSGTRLVRSIRALPDFKRFLNNLLRESDLGIDCIDFKILSDDLTEQLLARRPKNMQLPTLKTSGLFYSPNEDDCYVFSWEKNKVVGRKLQVKVGDVLFDFDQLSSGTRKLINMSMKLYLYKCDEEDTFLVIDELDCSLHSFVAKQVLQELLNNDTENHSQVMVTLHDTALMDIQDIWRKDQIWFVKKNAAHSSQLYSLADFDPRMDKKVVNDYLNGKFGAIPFLGARLFLKQLNEGREQNGAAQ